jgi:uncharacterized protein
MSERDENRLRAREQRRAERRRLLAAGPPSPCISVCQIDDSTGLCIGCLRTVDEIRDWIILMPEDRHHVLRQIEERRAAIRVSKGRNR